jgi:hypothetical protein
MSEATSLEKLMRPLAREMSWDLARALVNLQADPETQARYEELAEKRTQGSLTSTEAAELESLVRANTMLGVLKAEARLCLAGAQGR